MAGIPYLRLAALSVLAAGRALGAEVAIELNIIKSSRMETISYSTGDTATQEILQHGSMSAILTFDPATRRPTGIRFTGGVVYESDSSFTNTATINLYGIGKKQVTFVKISEGLQMRVDTIGPSQSVDSEGRVWDMDRLQTFPTAGTLTAKITIDGRTQTQSIDVATNPPDIVEPSTGTDMRLQLVELEDHGTTSGYRLTLEAFVDGIQSRRMPNTDTTLTTTTAGTTLAEAEFSAPNGYGQWLLDNGYSLNDQHFANQQGIHLAVLFAFNLPANDVRGLPWSFARELGAPVLTLRLPESGLEKAIQVESCADPRTGGWQALSDDDFLDGNSNLDRGDSGNRRILFSGTGSRFYRIVPGSSDN